MDTNQDHIGLFHSWLGEFPVGRMIDGKNEIIKYGICELNLTTDIPLEKD